MEEMRVKKKKYKYKKNLGFKIWTEKLPILIRNMIKDLSSAEEE